MHSWSRVRPCLCGGYEFVRLATSGCEFVRVATSGYEFVPISVEPYGRLSQPAMKLLHTLGKEAAGPRGVSRALFVEGALRELSVGLVRGNISCIGRLLGNCLRLRGMLPSRPDQAHGRLLCGIARLLTLCSCCRAWIVLRAIKLDELTV
jgi:hypothetical protein